MTDACAAAYQGSSDPAAVAARAGALGAEVIGRSRRGRALVAITVGAANPEAPVTLVLGGIHPLEWIGVEVALALAEHLAAQPPADRRVVIVPVINVDGHAAVAGDLADGRRRWRRGHAAPVDLNRNFATAHVGMPRWWPLPQSGPSPWSEPETAAVAALVDRFDVTGAERADDDHRPSRIDRAVALHSFGRLLLLPWAHTSDR